MRRSGILNFDILCSSIENMHVQASRNMNAGPTTASQNEEHHHQGCDQEWGSMKSTCKGGRTLETSVPTPLSSLSKGHLVDGGRSMCETAFSFPVNDGMTLMYKKVMCWRVTITGRYMSWLNCYLTAVFPHTVHCILTDLATSSIVHSKACSLWMTIRSNASDVCREEQSGYVKNWSAG